ncbi:Extradiol ring-cleavage dioxygenase, class III enzyme, subunit B [Leptodontidium sp. 2 PMI_412]|nr:Extradiol ring-cleavage dioxygenase, class III enzyme, subunit B [Leptodontidium sp. 2 PMI_412]
MTSTERRTPVYFLSHGGPNIMYEKAHPVYPQLQKIGREITQKVKPKAVLVFSAHWQGEPNAVEVNTFENTELIYDFYGFPDHYYKETYPNKGSFPLAQRVIEVLTKHNIEATGTRRGLDHGVWAPFKVAFDPITNPLDCPLIQVSLFASESPSQHLALGRAISSLRSENIVLIMSGMAVHNLRDMQFEAARTLMPYAPTFDEALRAAVEFDGDVEERDEKMVELLSRKDARAAHPNFDHLLPVYVGVGAAAGDMGVRLWTLVEGSFSWAMFRWGEVGEEGRL